MQNTLLQVISTNPQDSRTIQDCGANRIQLVSALQIGGVTPSSAILRKCLQSVSIPTHVIIRHHNNGFFYSAQQKQLMMQDIRVCKQLQVKGIVIGSLSKPVNVDAISPDLQFVREVIKETGGKINVVFHKASDCLTNFGVSIQILASAGIYNVLTQGGKLPITQNYDKLKDLSQNNWQHVLLGGGISHANKSQIMKQLNPKQIHIGTCVRQNKYGLVSSQKLKEFINIQ